MGPLDEPIDRLVGLTEREPLPVILWRAAADLEAELARLGTRTGSDPVRLGRRMLLIRAITKREEDQEPTEVLDGMDERSGADQALSEWWKTPGGRPDPSRVVERWESIAGRPAWKRAVEPGPETTAALREGAIDLMNWVALPDREFPAGLAAVIAQRQAGRLDPFREGCEELPWMLGAAIAAVGGSIPHPLLFPDAPAGRNLALPDRNRELVRDLRLATSVARDTGEDLDRMTAIEGSIAERVAVAKISGAAAKVAGRLVDKPVRDAGEVSEELEITHQGAMNALRRLKKEGLVVEKRRSGKLHFYATGLVEAFADGP